MSPVFGWLRCIGEGHTYSGPTYWNSFILRTVKQHSVQRDSRARGGGTRKTTSCFLHSNKWFPCECRPKADNHFSFVKIVCLQSL